jgi:hypothetical protein
MDYRCNFLKSLNIADGCSAEFHCNHSVRYLVQKYIFEDHREGAKYAKMVCCPFTLRGTRSFMDFYRRMNDDCCKFFSILCLFHRSVLFPSRSLRLRGSFFSVFTRKGVLLQLEKIGTFRLVLCNNPFSHTPNPSHRRHKLTRRGERREGKSPLCPALAVARGNLGVCFNTSFINSACQKAKCNIPRKASDLA